MGGEATSQPRSVRGDGEIRVPGLCGYGKYEVGSAVRAAARAQPGLL